MRQPEAESASNQHLDIGSTSLAARSAWAAWELLKRDERYCLLDYAEKAVGWEAVEPPPNTACCKTNPSREALPLGE